ncbi:KAP family P-loop NTPase fold protein [Plantactinospora sonchi]|uniref:KAP family NTPase n=1 Tax=Plantactinospora sonchi TaxID=1544735 RepID=A0ABU7RN90_9ACTN
MTHWTDEALSDEADDQLDRRRFANRVADLIKQAASNDESSVFGLVGPWGSGKSTLINFVEHRLRDPWKVVHFTPWAASSIEGLLAEFFAVIASALPAQGEARAKVLSYAKLVVPALGAIPLFGQAAKDTGDAVINRMDQQKPWSEQFQEASEQLKELRTPVLVVTDDIDRLEAGELATLLKAIRLLGRFPGVHYLLAYDQETLVDVLKGTGVAGSSDQRALAYLEKIVQYPLALPPARRIHLDRMLNLGLSEVLRDTGHRMEREAEYRFAQAHEDLLARTMITVRSIQRFLAQARSYLPLLEPGEVDVVDLLILTYFRMHFPTLYASLPSWRHELTSRHHSYQSSSSDSQAINWTERIQSTGVSPQLVMPVQTVLEELFPAVRLGSGSGGTRRVHHSDYFGRYFALGISDDDIADATVMRALEQAAAGVADSDLALFESTVSGVDPELGRLALRKAIGFLDNIDDSSIWPLVRYFTRLGATLPERHAALISVSDIAITLLASLLMRLSRVPDPGEINTLIVEQGGEVLTQAVRRALKSSSGRDKSDPVQAFALHFAKHARVRIIGNLAAKDQAGNDPIMTLVQIIALAGTTHSLTEEIVAGLGDGRWKIDDVAARFVSVGWIIGLPEKPELMGFDAPSLLAVLPTTRSYLSELPTQDGSEAIDKHDISWSNRRRFARRQLDEITFGAAEELPHGESSDSGQGIHE